MTRTIFRLSRTAVFTFTLLLLVVIGLSGCQAPVRSAASQSIGVSVPANPDARAEVVALLDGIQADKAALEWLTELGFHERTAECKAGEGYSYRPVVFDDGFQGWVARIGYTNLRAVDEVHDLFRPVDQSYVESNALGLWEELSARPPQAQLDNPGYRAVKAAQRKPYASVLQTCQPDFYAHLHDRLVPARVKKLKSELFAQLDAIAARPEFSGGRASDSGVPGYQECMAAAGYPMGRGMPIVSWQMTRNSVRHVYEQLSFGDTRIGWTSDQPQVKAARTQEIAAGKADADCRRQLHDQAEPLVADAFRQFRAQYRLELAALADDWALLRARAEQARREHPRPA